jgi:hypothetical protein
MQSRIKKLALISILICGSSSITSSANAIWYIDRLSIDEGLTTVDRMLGEDLLQVRSDVYYKVDVAQNTQSGAPAHNGIHVPQFKASAA